MTKHTIKIELPDGWEPVDDLIQSCIRKGEWLDVSLRIRQSWQWPEWLTAEWIVETVDGQWMGCELEPPPVFICKPYMFKGYTWELSGKIIDLSMTTFTPPPCANWRQSKRRNPRSAK